MKKIAMLLTGGVLSLGLMAGAAAAQESASQDMKNAGHETKNAAKDVGHGTATAAKKTGTATKNTTKKVVHKSAQKTDEGADQGGEQDRTAVEEASSRQLPALYFSHRRPLWLMAGSWWLTCCFCALQPNPCDVCHRLAGIPPQNQGWRETVFPIVEARSVARGIKLFVIKAPRIARKQKPGQFVIVRLDDSGERIPLTIADSNPEAGTVTIVVQAIGKTTMLFSMLEAGDSILDIVGPLGKPSEIENFGTAVIVSGSVGTAMAYPTARELKRAGNKVISIVGARSKDLLCLEQEVREVSDETYIVTDDGSYGDKGLVTDKLKELMAAGEVNYVLAVGPVPMMRAVANLTAPKQIKTMVSLNSIMVDGTGMCGGCRVLVGNRASSPAWMGRSSMPAG